MIFKGEPNLFVRLQRPIGNIKHIRFDENGLFETENPRLIKGLSRKFACNEPEPSTIDFVEEEVVSIDCKYCGGTHENKGQVLACARKSKSTKKKDK